MSEKNGVTEDQVQLTENGNNKPEIKRKPLGIGCISILITFAIAILSGILSLNIEAYSRPLGIIAVTALVLGCLFSLLGMVLIPKGGSRIATIVSIVVCAIIIPILFIYGPAIKMWASQREITPAKIAMALGGIAGGLGGVSAAWRHSTLWGSITLIAVLGLLFKWVMFLFAPQ